MFASPLLAPPASTCGALRHRPRQGAAHQADDVGTQIEGADLRGAKTLFQRVRQHHDLRWGLGDFGALAITGQARFVGIPPAALSITHISSEANFKTNLDICQP